MKPDATIGNCDPQEVTRFLRENPDWLAAQDGLYEELTPPRRVHGEILADHMEAMIGQARRRAALTAEQSAGLLRALRAGSGIALQVQQAVLALVRADDLESCIAVDLPCLLGIDVARLCGEADLPAALQARPLPRGSVSRLLRGREVVLREAPSGRQPADRQAADQQTLYGEAAPLARCCALLSVPAAGLPPMLLALAARDDCVLDPTRLEGAGSAALAFLGHALAARIESLNTASATPDRIR